MPRHFIEHTLPYRTDDLFALVRDIESYPRFLPWCHGARVIEHVSEHIILADLLIRFKGIHGKFTSRVLLDPQANEINVELAQGPFKHLYQGWKFFMLGNGDSTRVEFDIDFSLRVKVLEKVMDMVFNSACDKMMAAFEDEAKRRYGTA